MSDKLKTEMLRLPLTFVGGEQKVEVTIPDASSFSITSDKSFLKQVDNDDRDDKIIYAYTDSGVSENGRNWSPEIMTSIASQVVEKLPVGYLGHIKPQDYGFEFPAPQIVWFGSYTEELSDSTRLWIKGYLLPTSTDLEIWIKTKAVDSISVYGKISYTMDGDVMNIQDVDLKSIDIARKLGEGLNSGIAGLAAEMKLGFEMEATYEDINRLISETMRAAIKESPVSFGFTVNRRKDYSPYAYSYVRKLYVDTPTAIVSVEYDNVYKLFEVAYELNDDNTAVTITSYKEVVEDTVYEPKKNGVVKTDVELALEMSAQNHFKKEDHVMPNITIADVLADKELASALKTQFATEMATEQSQKEQIAKAGEMDKILGIVGGEMEGISERVRQIATFNAKFVGEMSAIFAGEGEEMEPDAIVKAAQEAVDTVSAVRDAVNADDDTDVVEAVKDAVAANETAAINTAIAEVDKAFEDKLAELDNEAIAEFIRDDFADIVGLSADDVEDDADTFKANALKEIEDNFDAVVKKYTERLAKIGVKSTAVGEMNAMQQLQTRVVSKPGVADDVDPDIAEALKLGYGPDNAV